MFSNPIGHLSYLSCIVTPLALGYACRSNHTQTQEDGCSSPVEQPQGAGSDLSESPSDVRYSGRRRRPHSVQRVRMNPEKVILQLACVGLLLTFPARAGAKSGTESAGDVLAVGIPAAAFGTALYLHDGKGETQFVESFSADVGIVCALKATVKKSRPDNSDEHAFPSAHSALAFQGASFIQKRYGWRWGLPAYFGATFVGWSRIENDKHDLTDVLAGAAIGTLCSYCFTTSYGEKGLGHVLIAPDGVYLCLTREAW